MTINITPPKRMLNLLILIRTKKFYDLERLTDIVKGDTNRYYIFIKKRSIQIKLLDLNQATLTEIQNYLNYTFQDNYLGISGESFDKIQLQGVRKIRL